MEPTVQGCLNTMSLMDSGSGWDPACSAAVAYAASYALRRI